MKVLGFEVKTRYALLVLVFLLLASYSLWEARFIILGPMVWINNPEKNQIVTDPLVTVEGRAINIAWISLNDRQIFTDEDGHWREELIVSEGTSIITVKARDRFGRETIKDVQIFLSTQEDIN